MDDLLRREVRATLQQFVDFRIPGVLALEKLVLRAEETEPLERQMLELLQQVPSIDTIFDFSLIICSGRSCRHKRRLIGANARVATKV